MLIHTAEQEENGEISIKVTPSEAPSRATRIKELGFSEKARGSQYYRNSKPFSSSLFLSATRVGVSIFQFIF